jgi:hypothetical protein
MKDGKRNCRFKVIPFFLVKKKAEAQKKINYKVMPFKTNNNNKIRGLYIRSYNNKQYKNKYEIHFIVTSNDRLV